MDRFYPNKLIGEPSGELLGLDGALLPEYSQEVHRTYERLLAIFDKNLKGNIDRDVSVYTGTSGYALLYLTIARKDGNPQLNQIAKSFAERSLERLRGRDVTFLCGDLGPLCVAAVIFQDLGHTEEANKCTSGVLDMLPSVADPRSGLPNELLYGRVGYLYGLLFLQKNIPNLITSAHLKQVVDAVITCGKGSGKSHLMWDWHGKEYLGGAHGVAGILYLLLEVKEVICDEDLQWIRNTVEYLLSIRYKSGNLPSSVGSASDRLVHWCHGAPGFVQLLLSATQVWRDKKYLEAAELCGEVVWQRGLLRKGYGICHGVAGNAYTFLALYQATKKTKHLHRALQFAYWCSTYSDNQDNPPDRPFSLFEGLAGTLYFLKDIIRPLEAVFPAYSIQPFSVVNL